MTVEQGAGKITIKSGHYAVELLGDADRWSLNRNQFTIARGDQILLQVERKETAEQADSWAASASVRRPGLRQEVVPVVESRHLAWCTTASRTPSGSKSSKRNEVRHDSVEAVNALGILAPEDDSEDAAPALLRLMRVFGPTDDRDSPRANLPL